MSTIQTYQNAADWDPGLDEVSESQYGSIITQFFPNASGSQAAAFLAALKARHFIYWHNESNPPHFHNGIMTVPGDCGGNTAPNLSTVQALKGGSGLAGLAGAILPLGPPGLLVGAILAPLEFVFAHHAKAVALEQNDLCGVFRNVNPILDDVDNNFYAGNITLSEATQALGNVRTTVQQSLSGIRKECNAACTEEHILDGILYLRSNILYPAHAAKQAAKVVAVGVGATVIGLLIALAFLGKKAAVGASL